MESSDHEKNYGPHIVAMMMGVCIGSYVEYGLTKEELLDLAGGMYDGVVGSLSEQGLEPGFGELTNRNVGERVARLKRMVMKNELPEQRYAALWYLLGQFEDELKRLMEKM